VPIRQLRTASRPCAAGLIRHELHHNLADNDIFHEFIDASVALLKRLLSDFHRFIN
jgi:hypothetical protein